jgi:transcription elongation factor Elf1
MKDKICPTCGHDVAVVHLSASVIRFECKGCGWSQVVDNRGRKLLTEIDPVDGRVLKG